MNHEFRTPLATSITFLEALLMQDLPAIALRHISLVKSSLCMLLNLVQGLLDLKALEENKIVPRLEVFEPRVLFHEIIELFKF